MNRSRFLIFLVILLFLLSSCGKKYYTDEDFEKMPAMELYQLFLDHGLVVPAEIAKESQEDVAGFFKQTFEGMKTGNPVTGYYGWVIMAESAKEIYQELTGEK